MSGFDNFFNFIGDLFSDAASPNTNARHGQKSGDPFLDEAAEELEAFLNDDREKQEKLRKAREQRANAEFQSKTASGPHPKLLNAYKVLGLSYGAPFATVKTVYKSLLKEHHPDKHSGNLVEQKKATEISARINDAYTIIETFNSTGKIPN